MIHDEVLVQRIETVESLVERLLPQEVEGNIDWRVKKLKDLIDNAPGKVHGNLGDVCSQLRPSLSARQARRLFKDSTGISIRDYCRKRRLLLAAKQLQSTDQPVKVVATEAGYQTPQGFEKSFHQVFRLTPVEFRENMAPKPDHSMNDAIDTNTRFFENQLLKRSSGKDLTKLVYRFERQDMTVTLSCRDRQESTVEFALGSEMRTFPLSEFIDFLLMMIEVGLKSDRLEFNPQEALRKSSRPKR